MAELVVIDEEAVIEVSKKKRTRKKKIEVVPSPSLYEASQQELDVKRESLLVLASVGETKKYVGEDLSLGDLKKLSPNDIEKLHRRYVAVSSKEVSGTFIEGGIWLFSKIVSHFLPIDDADKLREDLIDDKIVKRELKNASGIVVLKGGRLVALASALTQVAKHVKFSEEVKEGFFSTPPERGIHPLSI